MWITRIAVAGADLDLDTVLAEVVIRHGRTEFDAGPTSSSAQVTLRGVTHSYANAFRVGVALVIEADSKTRFTGTISDATLDDDELTVIGMGPLASLFRYTVGGPSSTWPAEPWHARVQRVFTEAGIPSLVQLQYRLDWDPTVIAHTATDPPVKLDDYLKVLADTIGAAICDTPDGHVLVQELSVRQRLTPLTWQTTPGTIAWNATDPTCSWEQAITLHALAPTYPDPLPPVTVDPADVFYVPPWQQSLALENSTTVEYGSPRVSVLYEDSASIGLYGRIPGSVSTELANTADANQRAYDRATRRGYPRWFMDSAPLLRGYELALGQVVELSGFPTSSPYSAWNPCLEGWTDTIRGDAWTCELALSHPLLSGVVLTWITTPATIAWNEVDPACSWSQALTVGDLNPALTRAAA